MNYQELKAMTGEECMACIRRAEVIWFDKQLVWGKELLEEIVRTKKTRNVATLRINLACTPGEFKRFVSVIKSTLPDGHYRMRKR